MGLFFSNSNNAGDYDFDSLRRDLVDEFGAQSAAFQEALAFLKCAMLRMLLMSSF